MNPTIKRSKTNDALSGTLIPLNSFASPEPSLICIGRDLSLIYESGQAKLSGILISPAGQITIVLSDRPSDGEIPFISAELQSWDCEKLDSIAADYTYQIRGQAYRIIDIMAERGHLAFSDRGSLAAKINQCMSSGSFGLFYSSESSI